MELDVNVVAIILMVAGIALVIASVYSIKSARKLSQKGMTTEGIVYDFGDDGYPIFRFTSASGEWITQQCKTGITHTGYKRGEKVTIIYDADKPADFIIKSNFGDLGAILMAIGGIGFFITGILKLLDIV